MPAAKTRKAKTPSKPAKKSPRPAARPAARPAKKASSAPRTAKAAFRAERTHCAATDPFGDPCQTSPRYGSRFCAVHSHLER